MYLFIAIIFIAELIIAGAIILLVLNFDKKVILLNETVEFINPKAEEFLALLGVAIGNFRDKVKEVAQKVNIQRETYWIKILQSVLAFLLIFMLKKRKKKYASAIRLGLALKDFLV